MYQLMETSRWKEDCLSCPSSPALHLILEQILAHFVEEHRSEQVSVMPSFAEFARGVSPIEFCTPSGAYRIELFVG
jgi:hypothetical protein